MSERWQQLQKFLDDMRAANAQFVVKDEELDGIMEAMPKLVNVHQYEVPNGHITLTFMNEGLMKLITAYYGSSFNESMSLQEYLEMAGAV